MNNKQIGWLIVLSGVILVLAAIVVSPYEARWFGIEVPMMYLFNLAEVFIFMYGLTIGISVGKELKKGNPM